MSSDRTSDPERQREGMKIMGQKSFGMDLTTIDQVDHYHWLHQELLQLVKSDYGIFDFIEKSFLDGLWFWDLQNPEHEWMSESFWTTLGYDPSTRKHLASEWQDIINQDDLKLATENFQKHCADPSHPYDQLVTYRHKTGKTLWIRCRGMAIRDEDGTPVRMLGAHVNVTELKEQGEKQALAEQEKTQRLFFEKQALILRELECAANIGTWEIGTQKQAVTWSLQTARIHEVPDDYLPDLESGLSFYKEGESRRAITEAVGKGMEDGTPWDLELELVTAKGRQIWVRTLGRPEMTDGVCIRLFGVFQDITDTKSLKTQLDEKNELERALSLNQNIRAELQRFKDTLDRTLDCVFIMDAKTFRFIYVNQGACAQLSYSSSELLKMHAYDIKPHYNTHGKFYKLVAPLLNNQAPRLQFQTLHRHRDGFDIPVEIALQLIAFEGSEPRFVAIVRDVTEQLRQQQKIEHLAYYDSLTNLPNRWSVRQKIETSMNMCLQEGTFSALLLMDLDNFKAVNDTLGHRAGDELLCEIATRLAQILEERDSVSRLGGDEFLMVLDHLSANPDTALSQARDVGDQILASVAKPLEAFGSAKDISTSVGIVLYQDANIPSSELMRMADIAMYDAKKSGKNCLSIFDKQMQQNLLAEEKLTVELREALSRESEIVPWLQPKVNEHGRFIGFEALVRWEHPVHGVMSPGQFITLAEGNNMIVALGDQVLLKSCEFMSALYAEFSISDLSIAVNVSQKQLSMPDFPDKVESILSKTGLPGPMLKLEITESVIAENIEQSIERMERLRRLGTQFSLDDFGTGFSSLSYLRQLPIDEVKIDRSFVESLLMDEEGYAMVRSILHMANSLNLSVVAEGIERDEQWQKLKELGCKAFQGYLFSRPMSLQESWEVIQKMVLNEV